VENKGVTMTARYLNIEAHIRQNAGIIVSLNDFTVSDGDEVDAGIILSNPNVSLLCFDDDNKRAIFAELPAGINLTKVPFVYATQYEQALRLIAVPYDNFRTLAHTLLPVEHLIMMYISGRSGSTLLHHVFNEVDTVMSLSEPDIITQFVHLRAHDHSRDAELRELFDCTVRMLFKPNPFKQPKTYVLKYRSETLLAMDLFHAAIPHTKNLYLYREAEGFVRSFYRVFNNFETPLYQTVSDVLQGFTALFNYDITAQAAYLDADSDQVSMVQWLTLWWTVAMDWYLEQAARDIPILAVRYADLNAQREQVVKAIFDYCGLPVEQVSKALVAFDRDSQEGTFLARENPREGNKLQLTEDEQQQMNRILARHPAIKVSDFIAPNTLKI
jgi:hypothetical protein